MCSDTRHRQTPCAPCLDLSSVRTGADEMSQCTNEIYHSEIYCTDMVSHSQTMTRINVKGSDDGRREARSHFPNAKPARKYTP